MRNFIQAYNTINSIACNAISNYIIKLDYRLRGFDNARAGAIESSFLYELTHRRLRDKNILGQDNWDNNSVLINKILSDKKLVEVFDVCKIQRTDYDKWFDNKKLCTYYENWERLAYFICEVFSVEVEFVEVICDVVMNMSATPIECLLEAEIKSEQIKCETSTEIKSEKITCDNSIDIKAMAENCLVSTDIKSEFIKCENKIDIQSWAKLCATKYNIDVDLVSCIIAEIFPSVINIDGSCPDEIDLNKTVIEVETIVE